MYDHVSSLAFFFLPPFLFFLTLSSPRQFPAAYVRHPRQSSALAPQLTSRLLQFHHLNLIDITQQKLTEFDDHIIEQVAAGQSEITAPPALIEKAAAQSSGNWVAPAWGRREKGGPP